MTLTYRPDIDGLRGIAVLAVVLYHFGVPGFTGGYVGVDVFFVVSGYLITGIVLREVRRDEFSIANFYERRIRRIFPALFVTIALTLAMGAVLFTPANFESLGKSAVAITLFVSNVFFWSETGYFNEPAAHKPLLHTWSLSVEEQFYIFYPFVLAIAWRLFGSKMMRWLVVIAGASLALSAYEVARNPQTAFYWAPTRGWELLLGGLIVSANPAWLSLRSRNAFAALGLGAIAASVFLFDANTPFPGLWAALPTGGTALILYTGLDRTTVVNRLLTIKLLVGVGLISYSLYLLHWPLLIFAQHLAIIDLTAMQTVGLLFVTLLASAVSWRWVERPCRSKQRFSRRQVFVGAGLAMSLTVAVGLLIVATDGLPTRFDTPARTEWSECYFRLPSDPQGLCRVGSDAAQPTFLLWGDSHARTFRTALSESATRQSRAGYLAYGAICPPTVMKGPPNPALRSGPNAPQCRQFNDRILEYVESHPELTMIVLVARWSQYGETGPDVAEFVPALRRQLSRLSAMGRTVVLVNQVPEVGYNVPRSYRISQLTGRNLSDILGQSRDDYAQSNRRVLAAFETLRSEGTQVLDVRDRMCALIKCRIMDAGQLLYADDNHLSEYGSHYISSLFDPVLATSAGVSQGAAGSK
jgi:peptidoglycan/LPS O-acetylase OafA/YrhL